MEQLLCYITKRYEDYHQISQEKLTFFKQIEDRRQNKENILFQQVKNYIIDNQTLKQIIPKCESSMILLNKDFKFILKKNDINEITNIFLVFFFQLGQTKKAQQINEFKERNCINAALIYLIIKWFIDCLRKIFQQQLILMNYDINQSQKLPQKFDQDFDHTNCSQFFESLIFPSQRLQIHGNLINKKESKSQDENNFRLNLYTNYQQKQKNLKLFKQKTFQNNQSKSKISKQKTQDFEQFSSDLDFKLENNKKINKKQEFHNLIKEIQSERSPNNSANILYQNDQKSFKNLNSQSQKNFNFDFSYKYLSDIQIQNILQNRFKISFTLENYSHTPQQVKQNVSNNKTVQDSKLKKQTSQRSFQNIKIFTQDKKPVNDNVQIQIECPFAKENTKQRPISKNLFSQITQSKAYSKNNTQRQTIKKQSNNLSYFNLLKSHLKIIFNLDFQEIIKQRALLQKCSKNLFDSSQYRSLCYYNQTIKNNILKYLSEYNKKKQKIQEKLKFLPKIKNINTLKKDNIRLLYKWHEKANTHQCFNYFKYK